MENCWRAIFSLRPSVDGRRNAVSSLYKVNAPDVTEEMRRNVLVPVIIAHFAGLMQVLFPRLTRSLRYSHHGAGGVGTFRQGRVETRQRRRGIRRPTPLPVVPFA